MQLVLVLGVFLASSAAGMILDQFRRDPYPRLIEFPDGDGHLHNVDLEEQPDHALLAEMDRNPARNLYLLYTRQNPRSAQTLVMDDTNSIRNSNFNARVPTVVIVHGWLSNQNTGINPTIRDAYLGKTDVNVIVMDWKRLAMSNYATSARGVPAVGRGLGQFIAFLNSVTGINYNSVHLVGFSLGAHLVGNAGRELGGRVARITALDPAGPLWKYNSNSIRSSDAVYVEGIHTDGGYVGYGIGSEIGNVDFFVNGGSSQPGCLTNVCDHNRAWELYAATVSYNHIVGNRCTSNLQVTLNNCSGSALRLGNDDIKKTGSGMHRANTGRRYPF